MVADSGSGVLAKLSHLIIREQRILHQRESGLQRPELARPLSLAKALSQLSLMGVKWSEVAKRDPS